MLHLQRAQQLAIMKKLADTYHCADCKARHRSVFNQIPLDAIEEVDVGKTCFQFKRGESIFYEGHTPQGVYCIETGKVKIYRTGPDGKDQIVRLAREGDMVGYRSLLSGERYSSTASCLEETTVCFVPKTQLMALFTRQSCLSMRFMQQACHELGEAGKLITNLAQKSVRERMAEVLLMLKETFGLTEDNALDVRLSREELSNLAGTATESCIRVLSDFQQEGLIRLDGKRIVLESIPRLVRTGRVEE